MAALINIEDRSVTLSGFAQRLKYVDFDVTNPEHIIAYIHLTQQGRQHPTLRFNLVGQYKDVHSMMNAMVGAAYAEMFATAHSQVRAELDAIANRRQAA